MHTRQSRLARLVVPVLLVFLAVVPASTSPAGAGSWWEQPSATPDKQTLPRLDTRLKQLAIDAADGQLAPDGGGGERRAGLTVPVKIRLAGPGSDVHAFLLAHGAHVAGLDDDVIEAEVLVTMLAALAEQPGVLAVRSLVPPMAHVTSQGAEVHGAPNWNAAGYTGDGVKVGVIDVGFVGLSSLMGSELPAQVVGRCYAAIGTPTANLANCQTRQKHGTGVAEALLDVAPDVTLYIANPQTTIDLITTVEWMAEQGVAIINHSIGWGWEGPGDGSSPYDDGALAAVEIAVAAGITWINSAGNEGLSTWTGLYSDTDADTLIEVAPAEEQNDVYLFGGQPAVIQLRWDDTWGSAARDLDLYLYDGDGIVVASSLDLQDGQAGQDPYEWFGFVPPTTGQYAIVVTHAAGSAPAWIQVQAFSGEALQHASASGSIGTPAETANPGLLAVGAAYWGTPETIEPFSSQGPTLDGRIKPDLIGVDGGDSASYGSFTGTSQSAPHVAGLAALIKQRFPIYTPDELSAYLKANAVPISSPSPSNSAGYGLARVPQIDGTPNPLPSLTALQPPSVVAGSPAITLTIEGFNFIEGVTLYWDGKVKPTNFVSDTRVTALIPAEDLESAGQVSVYVLNPEPGGGTSFPLAFVITGDEPPTIASEYFQRTWDRTDEPIEALAVSRTWMWGPTPFSIGLQEDYVEGPNGKRFVQYFDKSRMEITSDPSVGPDSIWYVTNGLLSKELITGQRQIGDAEFETHAPAQVNVAGDPDDPTGPTYATFTELLDAPALPDGAFVTQRLQRDGTVVEDASLLEQGVTAAYHVDLGVIDHQVASPFWEFMNSKGLVSQDGEHVTDLLFVNPFYATGYPITEAYWARVSVGGIEKDVLMQCFERRCLTFTPDNPEGWQVEAGNVGRHYFVWRYGAQPSQAGSPPNQPELPVPTGVDTADGRDARLLP